MMKILMMMMIILMSVMVIYGDKIKGDDEDETRGQAPKALESRDVRGFQQGELCCQVEATFRTGHR